MLEIVVLGVERGKKMCNGENHIFIFCGSIPMPDDWLCECGLKRHKSKDSRDINEPFYTEREAEDKYKIQKVISQERSTLLQQVREMVEKFKVEDDGDVIQQNLLIDDILAKLEELK